jgi:surface antigen
MYTLAQFVSLYLGEENVGDTVLNIGQCTGLCSVWLDNLGIAHVWGDAKDWLETGSSQGYTVVHNTPTNKPTPGDVVVWDATWGSGYGHVAIAVASNLRYLAVFEQNDPVNSPPVVATHGYSGVIGWLHPR